MRLRDELGVFYNDDEFAELYPDRGQSAIAPWRLTMILIMQFLENLSDRQALESFHIFDVGESKILSRCGQRNN